MRKHKIHITSIIIYSLLIGFLATTSVDAVTDFSGDYNGSWYCEIHNSGGNLHINLAQSAAIVNGTLGMGQFLCNFDNWPITGNVIGDALYFQATGTCQGSTALFDVSQASLRNNQLSGRYQLYFNGVLQCAGTFNVTKPIINPSGYIINSSAGTGGVIVPSGNVSVNAGASQTFNILPSECYKIADVQVDGASVGAINSYTFSNVSANHSITATFILSNFYINASAGAGGTIIPAGNIPINPGADQTFNISPYAGYKISDVIVDGVTVGAKKSYTFSNVSASHSIMATFEKVPNFSFLQLLLE